MREEAKVLKAVFGLVKGDPSPVHLPVSLTKISLATDLPLEQVKHYCKALENHGYLMSSKGITDSVYYITKRGLDEALNPSLPFYFNSPTLPQPRRRA